MHKENLHHFSPVNLHWVELLNRRCVLLIRLISTDQALALFQSVSFTNSFRGLNSLNYTWWELCLLYCVCFFVPQKATSDNNEHLSTLKLDKQHNGDLKQYSLCLT